ncbi:MAG TPA: hypothetical protein DHU72_02720 [Rikenellaceae bacterium]|nr:hypothetical protein [Rikenellaceae bacterium]HBH20987.1 hypothetical protein [Rikenellaceae bacterium]HCZ22386.1 hypothetical protein [Rikenellaceae bacterium]
MWQRFQTLLLFVSTVLIGLLFFCGKAELIGSAEPEVVKFTAYYPYTILLVLITLLNILALTSYKFRVFQMRTAVLSALLMLALQVWLAVDYFSAEEGVRFFPTALFPAASIILNLIAARYIFADELMVRSSSRLRSPKKHK